MDVNKSYMSLEIYTGSSVGISVFLLLIDTVIQCFPVSLSTSSARFRGNTNVATGGGALTGLGDRFIFVVGL